MGMDEQLHVVTDIFRPLIPGSPHENKIKCCAMLCFYFAGNYICLVDRGKQSEMILRCILVLHVIGYLPGSLT